MPARPRAKKSRVRIVLGVLALVCLAAYAFVSLPAVRARVRRELVEAVRRDFGLEADLDDVGFQLPFSLHAEGVSLRHPEHGLLAEVRSFSVTPSLRRAVMGQLKLRRVVIEGAHVRLRVVDGKVVNLPTWQADPNTRGSDGLNVLRELRVADARFEVDASPLFTAELHGVEVAAMVRDGKRLGLRVSVAGGSYDHGEYHEKLAASFLSGRYSDERLEVDSARVDTTLGRVSVKRARLELPIDQGRYQGTVNVSVKLNKLASLPLGLPLPRLDGEIAAAFKLSGSGKRYSAQGTLHADNPELNGFGFGRLDLKFDANPDELLILPGSLARIVQDGGEIGLDARIGLGAGFPVEARGHVKRLELHKLMAQLNVTQNCLVNWVLKGGAKIAGTIEPLDIKGPIWADSLSFKALTSAWHDPTAREVIATPPGRIHGRMAIRPDALRFENLTGKLPHSEIHATVHVGFGDRLGVNATSESLDLRDATGLMGMALTGHGAIALDVGGTYTATTLMGTADLADFSLDGYHMGQVKTRAALEKDGVAVRFFDSVVRTNDSRYVIDDMLLDFSEHFSIDAKARIEKLTLADFYRSVQLDQDPDFTPYQGRVQGDAVVRYTLDFPGDDPKGTLRVDTALTVDELTAYGFRFDAGALDATWLWKSIGRGTRGAELTLRDAVLGNGGGRLLVRGGMGLEGKLQFTLFGEQLALEALLPPQKRAFAADAELGFAGRLGGTVWLPEANLTMSVLGARVGQRALGDGNVSLRVAHQREAWLRAESEPAAPGKPKECEDGRRGLASATWGVPGDAAGGEARGVVVCARGFGGRLDVDAVVGVADDFPVRGQLGFHALPLVWFAPEVSPTLQKRLAGKVTGQLSLTAGKLARADSLFGRLEVSSLQFGETTTWLENHGPLSFLLRGDGLEIERAELTGRGTRLKLFGGGGLREGLRAGVEGHLDLSVLPSLTPEVRASSGAVDLAVKVSGDVDDPSVFGRAEVRGTSLSLTHFDHDIEGLSASLSFSEHEVLLESAHAQIAGGTLNATGSAAVDGRGIGRYELSLAAENVLFEPVQGVEVAFSADTTLRSRTNALPEFSGTIHVQRAVYKRPVSLGLTERLTGFSQARRTNLESYDPAGDHVALDVQVVNDGPLRVQNNILNAELRIDDGERPFRITGTDQRIGALGTLELTRGTLQFRNTQFLLDGGTVTFVDESRIRTRLDLSGRTEFRRQADASGARWLISLRARGDADNLKIETSSSPALAQEDIALLLTVGLTRAEAERLGTSALTQGAALEALASVTGVDREVKRALPVIDDFTVTSAYSARSNRTEPQVVVGKRISDRVRASATTGLTADSNFKTGVQWRLSDQTAVEAAYDNVQTTTSSQFGNVGVDLRWRLEFD